MTRRPALFGRALIATAAAMVAGCGSAKSPTAAAPPESTPITGSERLGWLSPGAADAATYTYRLYVDGTAIPLTGVVCGPPADNAVNCTAPLPKLGDGRHALELTAVNSSGLESPRSQTVFVVVSGS